MTPFPLLVSRIPPWSVTSTKQMAAPSTADLAASIIRAGKVRRGEIALDPYVPPQQRSTAPLTNRQIAEAATAIVAAGRRRRGEPEIVR